MAITANKFHNHKPASRLLASLLEEWIKQQPEEKLIFIPIPLSKNRERERGYNQVARILKNVKDEKIAIEPLLTRTKNTTPQTKLDRDLRLHNVTGVFAYQKPSVKLTDQHLVLIDDVVTTGATMKEAGKILKQNLPKNCRLTLLALAH